MPIAVITAVIAPTWADPVSSGEVVCPQFTSRPTHATTVMTSRIATVGGTVHRSKAEITR